MLKRIVFKFNCPKLQKITHKKCKNYFFNYIHFTDIDKKKGFYKTCDSDML